MCTTRGPSEPFCVDPCRQNALTASGFIWRLFTEGAAISHLILHTWFIFMKTMQIDMFKGFVKWTNVVWLWKDTWAGIYKTKNYHVWIKIESADLMRWQGSQMICLFTMQLHIVRNIQSSSKRDRAESDIALHWLEHEEPFGWNKTFECKMSCFFLLSIKNIDFRKIGGKTCKSLFCL